MYDTNFNYASCVSALDTEVDRYTKFVFAMLFLTLICSLIGSKAERHFEEHPGTGAKVMYFFAYTKIILCIKMNLIFPSCPTSCGNICNTVGHHYIYPTILFLVSAVAWYHMGNRYQKIAEAKATACKDVDAGEEKPALESEELV